MLCVSLTLTLARQGLGFGFMLCVMLINDYVILRGVDNFKSIIEKRNIGTACVEGGSLISSAIVVAAAAAGQYKTSTSTATEVIENVDFGEGIAATLLYWAMGQGMLTTYVLVINWLYSLGYDVINKTEEVELAASDDAP